MPTQPAKTDSHLRPSMFARLLSRLQPNRRVLFVWAIMASMLAFVGVAQSWNVAFAILNLCLISAIMSLGLNMQWGYAGLVNFGVVGFVAVGGLSVIIVSAPPVQEAWVAGGGQILVAFLSMAIAIVLSILFWRMSRMWHIRHKNLRYAVVFIILGIGFLVLRHIAAPAITAIEAINPTVTGYLGGLGLPILLSWLVAGVVAGVVAMLIGRISLGLRAEYLAIATLGTSEIIVYLIRNEDWLARGVKSISGLPRPVPYEIALQQQVWVMEAAEFFGMSVAGMSSLLVKVNYTALFVVVLAILFWMAHTAQKSPWGRMMRAIRDNEDAAEAMGKDVKARHLQAFIIGAAVIGMSGAMLTTLDGQFTPTSYQPLRFTFLAWIMVIVGGAGNNAGAVLGGFIIWFFWVQSEPLGVWVITTLTSGLPPDNWLRLHLLSHASHVRFLTMGMVMILVLRFAPQGLIPEAKREVHD